jgi:hypothetical protein
VRPDRGRPRPLGIGEESGQALLIALIALILIGVALALVAALLVGRMNRVQERTRDTALLALSDAALAETLADMAAWPASPGVDRRPFGGGTLESRVAHGAGGSFTVLATATFRGGILTVEARGRSTELGPVVDSWRRVPPSAGDRGGSFRPP